MPRMPNTRKRKANKMKTFTSWGTDANSVFTSSFKPFRWLMDRRGRRARNDRRMDTEGMPGTKSNNLTRRRTGNAHTRTAHARRENGRGEGHAHPMITTMKSSQFHASLRYEPLSTKKPIAMIFNTISVANTAML